MGMAGGLSQVTTRLLLKSFPEFRIIGVDSRSMTKLVKSQNVEYIQIPYKRSSFEKLFREKKFDYVIHLARMGHTGTLLESALAYRIDLNFMGTIGIMDLCLKFGVKKVVILSTHHVYGASSQNPIFIDENYPPKASIKHPQLRDVVEMDQMATNWMWKNQGLIESVVLRPSTILGKHIRNTMSRYLLHNYVPLCVDFNPMFQFIHEEDMAAILVSSLKELPTGVYNVATDEVISIKEAKKIMKTKSLPIPSFVLHGMIRLTNNPLWTFPEYLIDYIQYPCIMSNRLLKSHLGEKIFRHGIEETLEATRL